ncbi:hypothetical protein PR048_014766 [Dryococelus australis]|uniref:Uncharacterized protein n=1 Tax=Dryococelus australis TaxID=614101 RepID=A0ABQ9HF28_9NEOP|nr:hypothetical protein PR048_014766 [Dryococelus australis]
MLSIVRHLVVRGFLGFQFRFKALIGLLRHGRLLDEDCPKLLLRKYGVSSLEEAFLHLSRMQEGKVDSMVSMTNRQDGNGNEEDVSTDRKEMFLDDADFKEGSSHKVFAAIVTMVVLASEDEPFPDDRVDQLEVIVQQLRNVMVGETGDSRENLLSSGVVRHDSHMQESGSDPAGSHWQEVSPVTSTKDCCGILSKGSMRALLFKNIICSTRDPSYMTFIFGLCVVAVSALYVGFGFAPRGLRLAVVNHDLGSADPRCGRRQSHANCSFEDLSCRYLSHITEPTIVKVSSLKHSRIIAPQTAVLV